MLDSLHAGFIASANQEKSWESVAELWVSDLVMESFLEEEKSLHFKLGYVQERATTVQVLKRESEMLKKMRALQFVWDLGSFIFLIHKRNRLSEQ